ncbi:hypothetical protein NKG05_08500 [Oerskovia sp. M15]
MDRRAGHDALDRRVAGRGRAPAADPAHRGGSLVGGRARVRARGQRAQAVPGRRGRQPACTPHPHADHRGASAHGRGHHHLRARRRAPDVPRCAGRGASLLASAASSRSSRVSRPRRRSRTSSRACRSRSPTGSGSTTSWSSRASGAGSRRSP